MNWDAIGAIAETIGSVAILITLAYLAVQVRQANKIAQSTSGGALYDLTTTHSLNAGSALAFLALIGMPVMFGAVGFVVGALGAPLFNAVARHFRGVHLDIGTD